MADHSFSPAPRFLCSMATIILCAVSLPGQQNQQQQNEDVKPARIEGIVVSSTGEVVPRAEIRLTPITPQANLTGKSQYTTTGRDDGTFVIDNIAAPLPELALTARRPGYSIARFGAADPKAPVALFSLAAGQVRKDMVLNMIPQGIVRGTITGEEDDPVQGAQVLAIQTTYANRHKQLQLAGFAQTNDLGEYRMAELPPGSYYLIARSTADPVNNTVWLPTFYPNTADQEAAAPVQVLGGQELPGMDIQLLRSQGYTVSGKVTGAPINSAITVQSSQQAVFDGRLSSLVSSGQSTRVREDGSFALAGVLPGSHVLQAILQGEGVRPESLGMFPVTVRDQDIRDLVLPLNNGNTIRGSVRFEDDEAPNVAGIDIKLGKTMGFQFPPLEPGSVEADGTFTIEHLPSGEYYLQQPTLPNAYIKTVRVNGANVTGNTLNLNSSGTLDLVLGQDASKVTGVVRNGKGEPQGGMMVFLSPEKPNDSIIYRGVEVISTDINGAFTMETVPPGTYYAVAIEPLGNLPFVAREFPELFRARASKIEVGGGGSPSVDLELIPTTEVVKIAERAP